MNPETKNCQNCKKDFVLTGQDFGLLEKMHLPMPNFCAHCAMIDRMLWRNERVLYKHPNNAPGMSGDIVSIYAPESGLVIYDSKSWWGDAWDPLDYGQEYDFSRPFFEQFRELCKKVPFPALQNWNAVNSDYCNCTTDNKNCYMVFGGDFNEDSMYSMYNIFSKNVCDVYWVVSSEFSYELIVSERCYRVQHAMYARDCTDSTFLYDCVNCTNCTGCVSLRSRSNSILNRQYTKEEYKEALAALHLDTYSGREAFREQFELLKKNTPLRFAYQVKTQHVSGDRIVNAKDCDHCFDIIGPAENLKDCYNAGWNAKDMLRASHAGYGAELLYNSFGVFSSAQNVICSAYGPSGIAISYCYNCPNGSNLFGCVGVKKGTYAILNKRYSKEEYNELVPRIIEHMKIMPYTDSKGRVYSYGDFFPGALSLFAYNESVSQDLVTFTEAEIAERGYAYRLRPKLAYPITMKNEAIPDLLPASFEALKTAIIECAHKGSEVYCAGAFRVTAEEFAFYQRMGIPLPRYCFNCRNYTRISEIRSMTLRPGTCACAGATSANGVYTNTGTHDHGAIPCPNTFETAYPEEAGKILYCESCYQREVN